MNPLTLGQSSDSLPVENDKVQIQADETIRLLTELLTQSKITNQYLYIISGHEMIDPEGETL